jgi:nicotinamide phosphoribosyltransferase
MSEHVNLPLLSDSYHLTQPQQHPDGTTELYSHFLSRGGRFKTVTAFGLQYALMRFLTQRVTHQDVDEAQHLLNAHFGQDLFDAAGWHHLVDDHGGRIPLSIKALPEGTTVPVKNALFTVENTCPRCRLGDHFETLLVQNWYPTTVCTLSREIKKVILHFLELTGTPDLINFKLHDFGFRGVSSVESAGIGGAAHLVNFLGTDTLAALLLLRDYYAEPCAGFSIPASQHSTMGILGPEGELSQMERMLDKFPKGPVACVSDTFDIFRACSKYWGQKLREKVLQRDGFVVVRPDSGDPVVIVKQVYDLLGEAFGYERNHRGFKTLHPKVKVIQGDGCNYDSVDDILGNLMRYQWSNDPLAFGMGNALLQDVRRDDQKFKFACSSAVINGQRRDVYKDPVTDLGKQSFRGRVAVVFDPKAGYKTIRLEEAEGKDLLVEVYRDGDLTKFQPLAEIRQRAGLPLQMLLNEAA